MSYLAAASPPEKLDPTRTPPTDVTLGGGGPLDALVGTYCFGTYGYFLDSGTGVTALFGINEFLGVFGTYVCFFCEGRMVIAADGVGGGFGTDAIIGGGGGQGGGAVTALFGRNEFFGVFGTYACLFC